MESKGCEVITESIAIKGLSVFSLALTPIEQIEAAAATETRLMAMLTVFGVFTLIISTILLFGVRAGYRHIAQLTATNEKLRQEISELRLTSI
jgi:predicted amino acid racemase